MGLNIWLIMPNTTIEDTLYESVADIMQCTFEYFASHTDDKTALLEYAHALAVSEAAYTDVMYYWLIKAFMLIYFTVLNCCDHNKNWTPHTDPVNIKQQIILKYNKHKICSD